MHPVEVILTPLGKAFRNRHADEAKSLANTPQLSSDSHFTLTSSAFDEGQTIPAKYCGAMIGDNVSPALAWGALPAGTVDAVLLIEDISSPGDSPRVHTIAEWVPGSEGLAEGALVAGADGIRFVPRGGKPGHYAGPRPMPGHGPHHYRFHLYALDAVIDLGTVTEATQLPAALEGHVLSSGTLTGIRES